MLPLFFVIVIGVFHFSSGENAPRNAYSPGDIIIGGLFPVHRQTNRNTTHGPDSCSSYDIGSFLRTQVMIYAIREINQRTPRLLPNYTIGYNIYDTCGDVSFAIKAALHLLKPDNPQSCLLSENFQSPLPEPKVKAVIGDTYSEVSIAVQRVVALSSVAQISYASTSEQLSRKFKFPTFLRTISSDEHQTEAIVSLVKELNWKIVAIVGSDDEYGRHGSNNIVNLLEKMENICIEFVDILPDNFSQNCSKSQEHLSKLINNIKKSSAEAIIMFTKGTNMNTIMETAIKNNLNRTWIASDSWSTSRSLSTLPGIERAGEVFGFISKRNEVPGFKDYVISMFNRTTNAMLEDFLTHYQLCNNPYEENRKHNCTLVNSPQEAKQCLELSCLVNLIDQDTSYNIYLAVQAIVEGLKHLLKCDNHQCKHNGNFSAMELLMEIKKVNFTVNGTHIYFDANGDPSLGYDIVYWSMDESKQGARIKTIGEYWPNGEINIPTDLIEKRGNVMVTVYNCSKTCRPGQELKRRGKPCCRVCSQCEDGEFSAGNGEECQICGPDMYSSSQRDQCFNKTLEFLRWSDTSSIVLGCFNALGIVVTIVFGVLLTIYSNTPIVKAIGGYLSFLELFSLLVAFCSAFSITGKPTEVSCPIGMPMFNIAFSLCFSCILANLLQICVGFSFDISTKSWFKKLSQPLFIVTIVCGIQLALCVPWVYFYPPVPNKKNLRESILLQCDKGSIPFFITTLVYNSFLALSSFLFAYKGKQLPDLYKNAKLITTSMMLFLIIWILFIPIYISLYGKEKQTIESGAIIISSWSILGCHFAPKCYIMLFRKEINNENVITEYIRKHYEQKNMAVVKS